jgi:TIR domain-containing protein
MTARGFNVGMHVFMSFANDDLEIVRRLAARLEAEGLSVWTGDQKLLPGTLDWEQAVRQAIDTSFAVILVGSPASARSVYVRGEIDIAGVRGLPIFSVWAEGDSWPDCAPLMLTSSQYVDCRGTEFERGTARLALALRELSVKVIPNHFPRHRLQAIPPSCLVIGLPADLTGETEERAAVFKVGAYSSLETLLDDLYANYLREHYEPLTYGKNWLLVEARSDAFSLVVAPWTWLLGTRIHRQWVRHHTPTDCHLLPGTEWRVSTTAGDEYGIALTDARVLCALRATAKSDLAWREAGYLTVRSLDDIDGNAFACTGVCRGRSPFWREREMGAKSALVQVNPVPEEEIQWYLAGTAT